MPKVCDICGGPSDQKIRGGYRGYFPDTLDKKSERWNEVKNLGRGGGPKTRNSREYWGYTLLGAPALSFRMKLIDHNLKLSIIVNQWFTQISSKTLFHKISSYKGLQLIIFSNLSRAQLRYAER